jgi:hypothetical protein
LFPTSKKQGYGPGAGQNQGQIGNERGQVVHAGLKVRWRGGTEQVSRGKYNDH